MRADEHMAMQATVCAHAAEGLVDVEFPEASSCRGCEGACRWFRRSPTLRVRVLAPPGTEIGDSIVVGLPARYVLYAAVLLHGLPWFALLAGATIGALWGGSDLSCLVGAAGGVSLAAAIAGRFQHRLASSANAGFRALAAR